MVRALYGHPDAGTMWEEHCHKRCLRVGFEPIEDSPSCYFHKRLKLMLVTYVDDFKLAGPESNLREGWKLLESAVELEAEGPKGSVADRFWGCKHIVGTLKVPGHDLVVHGL